MNELVIAPIISWNDVIGFSALSGSKSMGSGLSAILERPKSPIFTCKQKNQKTMQHKWTLAVFIRIPTAHHLAFLCYRAINMRHDIFLPCVSQLVRSGLPCIVKQIRRLDIVVDDLSTSGVQVAQAVPESASCQEIQQFQTQIIILEKSKIIIWCSYGFEWQSHGLSMFELFKLVREGPRIRIWTMMLLASFSGIGPCILSLMSNVSPSHNSRTMAKTVDALVSIWKYSRNCTMPQRNMHHLVQRPPHNAMCSCCQLMNSNCSRKLLDLPNSIFMDISHECSPGTRMLQGLVYLQFLYGPICKVAGLLIWDFRLCLVDLDCTKALANSPLLR